MFSMNLQTLAFFLSKYMCSCVAGKRDHVSLQLPYRCEPHAYINPFPDPLAEQTGCRPLLTL